MDMSHKSRSFRLTMPDYMRGKRVVPIVRWVYYFISLITVAALGAALVTALRLVIDGQVLFGSAVAENAVIIGIIALAYLVPIFGLPRLFARFGVLTRSQAEDFRGWRSRWPESCLEPMPDDAPPTQPKGS